MSDVMVLLLQIAASVLTSLVVIIYIERVLAQVLTASCPDNGGQFWLRVLNLLLVFAPLLLVVLNAGPVVNDDVFHELRKTLVWILMGQCLALLLLSCVIWKTMVVPALKEKVA